MLQFWASQKIVMNYRAAKTHILRVLREELPMGLSYHGLHHTMDVFEVAGALCKAEGVKGRLAKLVKTAALLHDAGFVTNQHSGHEAQGCAMARTVLPTFGYLESDIEQICGMIMATKIPQSPVNLLEEIICDADLDYLGRSDFHRIAGTLFEELKEYQLIGDECAWNRLQVSFLTAHQYHTKTNRLNREPVKQRYLSELRELVASYD
jgi:uncharacterized protein